MELRCDWLEVLGCGLQEPQSLTIWVPGGGRGCHREPSGSQNPFQGLGWLLSPPTAHLPAPCLSVASPLTLSRLRILLLEWARDPPFSPWCACDACVCVCMFITHACVYMCMQTFFFLAKSYSLQDLSYPTRDSTLIGVMIAWNLNL